LDQELKDVPIYNLKTNEHEENSLDEHNSKDINTNNNKLIDQNINNSSIVKTDTVLPDDTLDKLITDATLNDNNKKEDVQELVPIPKSFTIHKQHPRKGNEIFINLYHTKYEVLKKICLEAPF